MLKHLYRIVLNVLLGLFCQNVSSATLSFLPLFHFLWKGLVQSLSTQWLF